MKVVLAMNNQISVVQQINEQQDFLLDCADSLLEWDMFSDINPVRGIIESVGINIKLDSDLTVLSYIDSMNQ